MKIFVVEQVQVLDLPVAHGAGEDVNALIQENIVVGVKGGDVGELVHAAHHVVQQRVCQFTVPNAGLRQLVTVRDPSGDVALVCIPPHLIVCSIEED